MQKMRLSFLALTIVTALGACTKPQNSKPHGYVSHTDDRWPSSTITTCFEQDGFDLDKSTVAAAVTSEFAKAGFKYTGWEKCKDDESVDLRVQFEKDSEGSRVVDFGNRLKGLPNGVILGLSHECLNEYSGSHCQANVALHEFGHAIGLHHEMNRQDDVDCRYQQTSDRSGEQDATQIGDFDPNSIMNYCKVFEANDKDEYLGLSEQDVATIRARYESPQAQLEATGFHILKDSAEFPGQVQGHRVSQYRYKLDLLESIDCKNLEGYSDAIGIETTIPQAVIDSKPRNRTLRLCLIGGDSENNWQSLEQYTSKDFVMSQSDGTQPVPAITLHLGPYGKDYLKLDMTFAEPLPAATISAELGLLEKPELVESSEQKVLVSKDEKTLSVLFKRDRLRDNGTVFVKRLVIFTRFYKSAFLSANAPDAPLSDFLTEEVAVPNTSMVLTDGFVKSNKTTRVRSLELEPARTEYATRRYLELTVDTDSDMSRVDLGFKLVGSDKTFDVRGSKVYRKGDGQYRVAIDHSNLVYKGIYRLQSLKVHDYFSEQVMDVAPEDTVLSGTSSKVPEIEITAGYPLNAKAPVIKDIVAPEVFDLADLSQDLSVKVAVESEIPVVAVIAQFVGRHPANNIPISFSLPFFSEQKGPDFQIEPYSTYGMDNDTYRLRSISLYDAGQNVTEIEIKPGDLVIPGTNVPVPQFKTIGGDFPEGPAILSVKVDAASYKKGDTMQVRITTTEEQPLISGTVSIRSLADPSIEFQVDFDNPGGSESLVTIPIDEKFKASGAYLVADVYGFDEHLNMLVLSLIDLDKTEYWFTQITAPRFHVQ